MILEHTYDNKKICNGCIYFNPCENLVEGHCTCTHNKIRSHFRWATDKKCSWWTRQPEVVFDEIHEWPGKFK